MRYRDAHHFAMRKVKLLVDQSRAILFERKHGVISESVFAATNRHLATNQGDSGRCRCISRLAINASILIPQGGMHYGATALWRLRVVSKNARFGVLEWNVARIVPVVRTEESRGRTCDSFFHHFV